MKLINNRYKLLDVLRKDVYGTTFIAIDLLKNNIKIILKIIDVENKDRKFIEMLMTDFISIASIEHMYIQKCHSFSVINTIDNKDSTDIQYFYTTEYVGESLGNYGTLFNGNVKDIFIKLCYALNYLHFRGIIYKFLSFKNIMITDKEKGIDYKLRDLVSIYQYNENMNSISEYNSQFVAPEIKLGKKGDNSSDIYSLGVICFYLVSGVDYRKNNFNEAFKKNNDDDLYKIIERMTALEPSSRYRNILEVINDIKSYLSIDYDFIDKDFYERLNFKNTLVSREKEKNLILESIKRKMLEKSKSQFIFINGESGIGKSRFVKEIDFLLNINKIKVCFIQLEQKDNQMFYIYKKILKWIVQNNKIDNALVDKYGKEIVKLLPDLVSIWNIKPSESLAEDKEVLRLNNRIYNFINKFTSKNPLVVIIDNINNVHENDLNIFEYLVRNTNDSKLAIISTYTHEESHGINKFLYKLEKERNTKFIQLNKFNFEETAVMLKNILGMGHKPLKLTSKVMEETNGNPRYVEEIVRSLFIDKKIYINENRLWTGDIDDIHNLKLPSSIDEDVLESIHSLDTTTRKILDIISIFNSPVSLQTICKIIGLEQNMVIKFLVSLVSLRIINENFEDWGYSYDYYDKNIKKFIYGTINPEERKVYHLDAANILEDFYINEGRDYTIELVYHFDKSRVYDKLVTYCIKSGEKVEQLHVYNEAIVFYNRAVEILKDNENDEKLIDVLMKMGDIYFLTGRHDKAFEVYTRVADISKTNELQQYFVDAKNKLANIYFYIDEIDKAKESIEDSISLAQELEYIEGELEGVLLQSKLLRTEKAYLNLEMFLNKYIEISSRYSKYRYTGEFFNEKGKLCFEQGQMIEAHYSYVQSIFYFEKAEHKIRKIISLNDIGTLYLKAYKNINRAREYYTNALGLLEKYNYITNKGMYLINIGETYFYEDNYNDAINYFNEAVNISIEVGDTRILFAAYIHLCSTYLNLYQYDKAYFYLKKLEAEFDNYKKYDSYYYNYYIIHIEFYTQIHNYSLADKWYNDFYDIIKDNREIDFDIEMEILEFKMHKIKFDLHFDKPINIEEIKSFLLENIDKVHFKTARDFFLDSVYILILKNETDFAQYLIDLDSNFMDKFSTDILDFKRSFAVSLLKDNKIEIFNELLNKLENKELHEYEWKIFKVLGDEYYKRNDYFTALSNYITSLYILRSLAYRIPENLRESYIFSSNINYVIRKRIEDLKEKILNKRKSGDCKNKSLRSKKCIEEFFDFSDLNILFNNKKFINSIYKKLGKELSTEITELKDIIQNLKKDELYNIKLILRYCFKLCLAEKGFVFITNEQNEIQEIINIGNNELTQEIKDVLKSVSNKGQNIIITNENQFNSKGFKHNEVKSLLCIAIKNFDEKKLVDINANDRRKIEDKVYSKEIVGYLYLDTKRVFSNFTHDTYKKCFSLINLLYFMIQNYDLKKTSSIDKLTNIYLRKHIEDLFKKEMLFSHKNELKLSVVMCDIDKFKHINDFYGHRKGDEVLAKIGEILKNNLRKTDLAGRYGGEEFIIILPETDSNDAYLVCEKLRKAIEDSRMLDNDKIITMSFGISSYPKHGKSEEELIERADQALYKSKKSGRNKTTVWNKDIGYDKYRYDKLAGIITGNISTDHRNVNFIIDIIELLKKSNTKTDKIFKILGYFIEITQSEYGAIFEIEDNTINNIFTRERANSKWSESFKFNEELVKEFIYKKQADFFIDWNEAFEIDGFKGIPNWNSYIIVPLINNDVQKGILLLSVPISEKEFDFNVFNLVNSLSGIIASML